MANISIQFIGEAPDYNQDKLQVYATWQNKLCVSIEGDTEQHIILDLSTAIRFSKEVRKQIALIKKEVGNEG